MTSKHEWIDLDPAEYSHLDAVKVKAFRHSGRDQVLLVAVERWKVITVLHLDEDGFSGVEEIDTAETLDDALAMGDELVEEYLALQ